MTDSISPTPAEQALDDVAVMLAPLVRWLLVQGIPLNALVRTLRGVYLSEAHDDLGRRGRRVTDSALSVLTGIHRKEVRVFMESHHESTGAAAASVPRLAPTPAATLFTQWITDPGYRVQAGEAEEVRRELPRHGPAPSFEALAREASRDVHPRTLLEELERLELVEVQPEQVRLLSDRFVPPVHDPAAVRTMAVNVADHIAAAVHNLRADTPAQRQLEQSVYADGLSTESAVHLGEVARQLWGVALEGMVREARVRIAQDHDRGQQPTAEPSAQRDTRVRFGIYYHLEVNKSSDTNTSGRTE
ncbi:DUF6502 family protein [Sphaerotilus sp.]|jgi:Family of unknown function (DUF6502)|uniref:DUF6502 family protein n=1 Tax=Sphaerotilus sp. TaxID=2093942 RepID=UPI0025FBD483|nr:DUF6502 family protein [Sphaerotilus sp.]